jgi:hypothetical protein
MSIRRETIREKFYFKTLCTRMDSLFTEEPLAAYSHFRFSLSQNEQIGFSPVHFDFFRLRYISTYPLH